MQTEKCDKEKQSKLDELLIRISDISNVVNCSRDGLDNILDRLLGQEPECETKGNEPDCRVGIIGQLEDSVDVLNRSVGQIKNSIHRLSEAGIA